MEPKAINKVLIQCDNTYRLIIIGANGVGKTSLVTTFIGKDGNRHHIKMLTAIKCFLLLFLFTSKCILC